MTELRRNPFLTEVAVAEPETTFDVRDDVLEDKFFLTGPSSPDLVDVADAVPPQHWDINHVGPISKTAVIGLHGGAGTSTVAALMGAATVDLGQGWPVSMNPYTGQAYPVNVIAVARDDAAGLEAAERFAHAWAGGALEGSTLRALVLVASSPTLSEARKRRSRTLLRMIPHGTRLPWMDAWIEGPADPQRIPRRLKSIVKALHKISSPPKEKS